MKKHQLAAMVLSALSAGVLISCTKPNEDANNTNEQEVAQKDANSNGDSKSTVDSNSNTNQSVSQPNGAPETIHLGTQATTDYLNEVAKIHIIPAYQDVTKQSDSLHSMAKKVCQSDGSVNAEDLASLREQWVKLAKSWAYAEMINFGPAMDSMSNLYINYYPDERGLVHQGVIDLIDANPKLTPDQLASESAVVQGIPGLEEVLYSNDSLDAPTCQYVVSASSALSQRLHDVQQAWESQSQQLLGVNEQLEDAQANDQSANLGMNRWINSLLSLVETAKSRGLDQPLGLTGSKKGHLPADSAGKSRDIINAKVSALNDALTDPKLVALLNEHGQDTLTDKLSTSLAQTSTLLAQLPEDIGEVSKEQQQELYDHLTELTQIIKHELMPTLGVQVGFNSTDGD